MHDARWDIAHRVEGDTAGNPLVGRDDGSDLRERVSHCLAFGTGAGNHVSHQVDRVIGCRRRLIGKSGVGILAYIRCYELSIGRSVDGR
jgi:hypothetical protein